MFNTWGKKITRFIRGWLGSLVIAFLLATSIKSAIADWYVVPTGSMKPTIVEGDRIFVNKLAYDLKIPYTTWHLSVWDNPQRGDIVVFYSPKDNKRLVKRVVGLPGDVVAMRNNRLFLNGKIVEYDVFDEDEFSSMVRERGLRQHIYKENFGGRKHSVMITYGRPSPRSFDQVDVPEGHYFMMGDNRDNSADSRYFGFVKRRQIIGRATSIVISLDADNRYYPRWNRFFSRLQ